MKNVSVLSDFSEIDTRYIKQRISKQITPDRFNHFQRHLYNAFSLYSDSLITIRNEGNAANMVDVMALHVMNHVLKARDAVVKHNLKLKHAAVEKLPTPEFKDQVSVS